MARARRRSLSRSDRCPRHERFDDLAMTRYDRCGFAPDGHGSSHPDWLLLIASGPSVYPDRPEEPQSPVAPAEPDLSTRTGQRLHKLVMKGPRFESGRRLWMINSHNYRRRVFKPAATVCWRGGPARLGGWVGGVAAVPSRRRTAARSIASRITSVIATAGVG